MRLLSKIILFFLVYYAIGLAAYYIMTASAYSRVCGKNDLFGQCPDFRWLIKVYLFGKPKFYLEMIFWPLKVLGGPPIS